MNFSKVNELKNKLQVMRPLTETELARLQSEFIIENTYNSNAIEGNTLTLRETALILQEGITISEKPVKEHLEAIGHKDAFDYLLQLADKKIELTEQVIKAIHSLVLMNDATHKGVYRNVPVSIVGAFNTPPQPYLIAPKMEQLIIDYNDNLQTAHILEAVSKFHLQFEEIHPFIDGNGRTGRLILNFELIKAGFLPVNIKFSDKYKYYECFDSYFSNENIEPLVKLITEYEELELEKYINIMNNRK